MNGPTVHMNPNALTVEVTGTEIVELKVPSEFVDTVPVPFPAAVTVAGRDAKPRIVTWVGANDISACGMETLKPEELETRRPQTVPERPEPLTAFPSWRAPSDNVPENGIPPFVGQAGAVGWCLLCLWCLWCETLTAAPAADLPLVSATPATGAARARLRAIAIRRDGQDDETI